MISRPPISLFSEFYINHYLTCLFSDKPDVHYILQCITGIIWQSSIFDQPLNITTYRHCKHCILRK